MPLSPDEKLVWLGLKTPTQSQNPWEKEINTLKNLYDFGEIQSKFENDWGNFADYAADVSAENVNGGIEDYAAWENKLVELYDSPVDVKNPTTDEKTEAWGNHESEFLNEYQDYSDFENIFMTGSALMSRRESELGGSAAGVRVHEEAGVTKNGDTVPAGSLEIWGHEVHFAETQAVKEGAGSGGSSNPKITYRNLNISNTSPTIFEPITVTADVKNDGDFEEVVSVPLKEDGTQAQSKTITLQSREIQEIEFTVEKEEQTSVDIGIGDLPPESVTWVPTGFVQ